MSKLSAATFALSVTTVMTTVLMGAQTSPASADVIVNNVLSPFNSVTVGPGYGGYRSGYGGYEPRYGGYEPRYGGYEPRYGGYGPRYRSYEYAAPYNDGYDPYTSRLERCSRRWDPYYGRPYRHCERVPNPGGPNWN